MPAISRANYARELRYTLLFSTTLAIVEGGVVGVLVKNAFADIVTPGRLAIIVALLGALPEGANISSFVWAGIAHGREKVRLISRLQLLVIVSILAIAAMPRTELGLYLTAGAVVAARLCIAGIVTLRAALWRANYSRFERAKSTGKFSTISVIVIALTGFLLGRSMDWWVGSYRVFVPLVCLLGLFGGRSYQQIRMRGRAAAIKAEKLVDRAASFHPMAMVKLLRQDRYYARFMGSMFVIGFGNLMLTAPLVITLKDRFGQGYLGGIAVTTAIPYLVMPWFIPMWARLLAKKHVVHFRTIHSWVFVLAQAIVLTAVVTKTYWLLFGSSFAMGVAMAGGTLAWNLGHLDFAPGPKAAQYMGVHVTLNGVRGIVAPFLAVGLYRLLEHWQVGAGAWVFAVSVVLCALGAIGFAALGKAMGEKASARPRD